MANIYGVFEDEKMIYSGTATEIAVKYGLYDRMTVYNYANKDWKLHRKYSVKFLKKVQRKLNASPKKYVPSEHEIRVANAITMMRVHGNLYARNPEEYRKELESEGLFFTQRKCSDGVGYILERRTDE